MMTYTQATDWLFQQFPAFQRDGLMAYKPDVGNILELCRIFEIPYEKLKYVHIAGTNGKGSCCHMLASVFQEASYKTGLFTSPHLIDFTERIRVNGVQIPEEKVISFCEQVKQQDLGMQPSFFEITWLMALKHFLEEECEICVIEVGMGGRLDATNIIRPLLSVITRIGMDHAQVLGDSLEKIAFEKAGIIKREVPVLIGKRQPETEQVYLQVSHERKAPLYYAEECKVSVELWHEGAYQQENERTVRGAVSLLREAGVSCTEQQVLDGIRKAHSNTGYGGRMHRLKEFPNVILDAAHNEDGIRALLRSIPKREKGKLIIIFGSTKEKDQAELLELFPLDGVLIASTFRNPRSVDVTRWKEMAAESKRAIEVFSRVSQAWDYAQSIVNEGDQILICGSFFLLSDFFTFFSRNDLT
ncbi:MAG: bifunctional folylpolyglutamate synthase/dihydrofolate synthase [Bacteroidetes bacterium]|nr:MAG: bifunctional folylpolyglutamate synthase/dihydrofolate synthase [Bacteroidota bacterium]